MKFDQAQVRKVAELARLKLSDEEAELMGQQLGSILDYVEQLQKVDTTGVEPMAHCLPVQNVLRDDQVVPGLPVDEALANAPRRRDDFYSVPAIFD